MTNICHLSGCTAMGITVSKSKDCNLAWINFCHFKELEYVPVRIHFHLKTQIFIFRLHFRHHVVIKNLSINVASSDSSYMPEHVTVTAGRGVHSLREIKDVRIPSSITGDVVLLKNAKIHYPCKKLLKISLALTCL